MHDNLCYAAATRSKNVAHFIDKYITREMRMLKFSLGRRDYEQVHERDNESGHVWTESQTVKAEMARSGESVGRKVLDMQGKETK